MFSWDCKEAFKTPKQAIDSVKSSGFDWGMLRQYFKFTDQWLREGEYQSLLNASFASLKEDQDRELLVQLLDLQYLVLLEQATFQSEKMGDESPFFFERVAAYLQINTNVRNSHGLGNSRSLNHSMRSGDLYQRLLGA
jgi:hypothetical protein